MLCSNHKEIVYNCIPYHYSSTITTNSCCGYASIQSINPFPMCLGNVMHMQCLALKTNLKTLVCLKYFQELELFFL